MKEAPSMDTSQLALLTKSWATRVYTPIPPAKQVANNHEWHFTFPAISDIPLLTEAEHAPL
jgi:hypothetical protein